MNVKDKNQLIRFLKSQNLMALATNNKAPWVCTAYYLVDGKLNLYFISSPDSKHCKDIEKNGKVACAIYDSHTPNSELKIGVQIQGTASQVRGWDRTKVLLKMWHKAAPGAEEIVNIANMKDKVISSRVYRIKPTLIKFFNQKLYKEEECKILRSI
jgi:uncharacterized protein YhbP (UPF0306 family)